MRVTSFRRGWHLVMPLVLACALSAGRAEAQISGATLSGSGCNASSSADGSTVCSSAIQTNNGTTLATRFAFNVNADVGAGSTRNQSGNATHQVSFTATAPGGYRLDINTDRVGAMSRVSDVINCDGSADTTAVTGSSNIALNSGTISLADPGVVGVGGGDSNISYNQDSGTAQIFRVSNGVGQSHVLTFTFSASVRSNSCEASVRVGEQRGGTTGCDDCGYPGTTYPRTQASDGHFFSVTYTSLCGNGSIDSSVGEQCDLGGANGASTSCCTSTCQFRAGGQTCRPNTGGGCDVAETCTGSSGSCPTDGFLSSTTVCRPSAGVCDLAESCTGGSGNCPVDAKVSTTTVCRPSAGVCDVAESCNGGNDCPADGFVSSTTTCRPSAGTCDVAESCTGSGAACPADGFASSTTTCRPSAGTCDVAESCTGSGAACPADAFLSSTTTCRPSAGDCDVAESCTGSGAACPADGFLSSTTICRASAGDCDVAESCTGSGAACPADAKEPNTTECRAAAGDCDIAESCDGVNDTCPADQIEPATTECRPAAGNCDVAESCDGVGVDCPADVVEPNTTECRAVAGDCDVAENCDGVNGACPADVFEPNTVECRASNGVCDLAENCSGASADCPADGKSTAVCRPGVDVCDATESCDGVGDDCPADAVEPDTTVCRADAGDCDVAELCDGASTACPADAFEPALTACGDPSDTDCDNPDTCDGAGACDANLEPALTACGDPSDTDCDDPDTCDGAGACDANPATAGTSCADDGEACTVDECDGAGTCDHPAGNSGTECRPAAGDCDVAEQCDGASPTCPADAFAAASTPCGDASDTECSNPDSCDGSGACEPNDEPSGTACSDGDACTTADECDGSGACDGGAAAVCAPCEVCQSSSGCTSALDLACEPGEPGQSLLVVVNKDDPEKDRLLFKWRGANALDETDFGTPTAAGTSDYELCLYDDKASPGVADTLVYSIVAPAGGTCSGSDCWREISGGYLYKDNDLTPAGAQRVLLRAGSAGRGRVFFKAKGPALGLTPHNTGVFFSQSDDVTAVLVSKDAKCFRADFPRPWSKNLVSGFKDKQ